MITLSKVENAIRFTFVDSKYYLYESGTIDVPKNSLSLIFDESDAVTFRKSASNDIFISAPLSEFTMSKSAIETFYNEEMCGGLSSVPGGDIVIDDDIIVLISDNELSTTSLHPVKNYVITNAVYDRVNKGDELTIHTVKNGSDKTASTLLYVKKITTGLPDDVKERYQLVDANGDNIITANGNISSNIDIPKDSSIVEIYLGCSGDSVNETTGVITKLDCDKKEFLNYVYLNNEGKYYMTKINLEDFLNVVEFESGVTVVSGTVIGVCDPRQQKVYTQYDASGNPSVSASVLSVGASGFTVNNIQDAINAKVLIDRRLYTPKEGEYNKANQEITFKSDLDDELFIVDLSGDTALDSGSTNYVENSAITEAFEDVQDNIISSTTYVASSHTIEYNNRKDIKLFETVLDVDNDLDSGSTNPVVNSAVTEAINDLEERKADWVSAVTSGDVSASTSAYTLNYTNRSGDTLFSIELPKEEGKLYKAGRAIKIESGDTADTISFDLPIYSGSGRDAVVIGDNYSNFLPIASGARSFATGIMTQANNREEVAFGQLNISRTGGDSEKTLFTVGNGDLGASSKRHNAFEIRQNGDIYIADTNASGEYYRKPMIKLQDAIGGDSVKGDENTIHTEINADEEKVVSSLVYVNKITTGLPETVKERYQLVGADGNPYTTASGDTSANIDIYKDSHIVSITYITGTTDPHYQNLEYKYIDVSGNTQTTYVDISEVIIEAEVGDGLEVDSHIIKGKIDANSEKVVTSYNDDGTSAATANVLSVGADGFKVDNIQNAIDAVRHGNLIDMSGFTSGVTEDLFGIVATDTVSQAVKKIEDKLCSNGTGVAAGGGAEPNNTGLVFLEGGADIVILSAGEY